VAPDGLRQRIEEAVSAILPVDEWEAQEFDYIGSHIRQTPEGIYVTQTPFVDGRLFTLDISAGQCDEDQATESQAIDNRSLVGALSWLAGQSRPDLQCGVSMAQQAQKLPTVADLKFTKLLARRAYELREEGLLLRPFDLSQAAFYIFHDAAWANAPCAEDCDFQLTPEEDKAGLVLEGPFGQGQRRAKKASSRVASQLGYAIVLGPREGLDGQMFQGSLLDWRSHACARVCRSTFGGETIACVEGLEAGQYVRACLAALLTGKVVKVEQTPWPLLCLTDCRSLYDHLHKAGPPKVPAEKRLAVDLAALRQSLDAERPFGGKRPLAWIPTGLQLADILTKPMRANDWFRTLREGVKLPWTCKEVGKAL
jgi:hypothetical protein